MKKIITKITTIVLILAMLIPYVSMPTRVEAATEDCGDGEYPEYHTNYYFFLQSESPYYWVDRLDVGNQKEGKYQFTTNYYTEFMYNFPSDGSKIIFEDEGFVKITRSKSVSDTFNASKSRTEWTAAQFYRELYDIQNGQSKTYSNSSVAQYSYTENNGGSSSDNRIVSYLYHGAWANLGETYKTIAEEEAKADLNNLAFSNGTAGFRGENGDLVDASILINQSTLDQADIGASNAMQDNSTKFDRTVIQDAIENYNSEKKGYGVVVNDPSTGDPLLKVIIRRTYTLNDIFTSNINRINSHWGVIWSLKDKNNKDVTVRIPDAGESEYIKVVNLEYADYGGTTPNGAVESPTGATQPGRDPEYDYTYNNITQRYWYSETGTNASIVKSLSDSNTGKISWILAPTLYQISYKVCKTGTPGTDPNSVTLTYDGNEDGVSNVPDPDTKPYGSAFTVSTTVPTKSGDTFKGWATNPKCTGTIYESGSKFSDSLTNNTTLWACWGSTGGAKEPNTGVLTYAGLFTGIIALAGGAYYVVKRKDIFKKI